MSGDEVCDVAWVEYRDVELSDGVTLERFVDERLCENRVLRFGSWKTGSSALHVERAWVLFYRLADSSTRRCRRQWRELLSLGLSVEQVLEMEVLTTEECTDEWVDEKQGAIVAAGRDGMFGVAMDVGGYASLQASAARAPGSRCVFRR